MSTEMDKHWRQGVADFNSGRYWHAHEAWEHGWRLMPACAARTWVQAMIQVAGVYVLLEKGRASGARSLAEAALEKMKGVEKSDGLEKWAYAEQLTCAEQAGRTVVPQKITHADCLPRIDGSAEALKEVVRGLRADETCEFVLATLLRRRLRASV
jgi:hypothetical protein